VGGQSHAPAALPSGKRSCNHFIGGWVGPRASLDGCEKSRWYIHIYIYIYIYGLFRACMTLNIFECETVLEENIKYEVINYFILYNKSICCDNDNSFKQENVFSVTKCYTVEFILLVRNQKKMGVQWGKNPCHLHHTYSRMRLGAVLHVAADRDILPLGRR